MNVSLSNVISGRVCDGDEWRDLTAAERETYLEYIKASLLSKCRSGSGAYHAIRRMSVSNLPRNIGLYKRVTTGGYIAGQDYPGELKYIKQRLVREL